MLTYKISSINNKPPAPGKSGPEHAELYNKRKWKRFRRGHQPDFIFFFSLFHKYHLLYQWSSTNFEIIYPPNAQSAFSSVPLGRHMQNKYRNYDHAMKGKR